MRGGVQTNGQVIMHTVVRQVAKAHVNFLLQHKQPNKMKTTHFLPL